MKANVELGYTDADMQAGFALKTEVEALPAPCCGNIQAAINEGAKRTGGKVGITGFCWGGLLTWRAACELKGLAAAVTYYGGGMTTPEEAARQPVLDHGALWQQGPLDFAGVGRGLQAKARGYRGVRL